ncbi:hypothetical protein D3C71_983120 [compost metagenome]
MGIRQFSALKNTHAIAEERQWALRRYPWIKLTQRSCRSITRVSKQLSTGATRFIVNLFKARLREEHFTAHFEACGNVLAAQLKWYCADGPHVGGDVFTGCAIAARGGAHQHAIFIQDTHRQTVELQLTAPCQRFSAFQSVLHALVEGKETLFVKDVIQRQHRHFMTHLAERGQRSRTHALRRRIRGDEIGVLCFQLAQFAHQAVILRIRDFRCIHHVIQIFMMAKCGS